MNVFTETHDETLVLVFEKLSCQAIRLNMKYSCSNIVIDPSRNSNHFPRPERRSPVLTRVQFTSRKNALSHHLQDPKISLESVRNSYQSLA